MIILRFFCQIADMLDIDMPASAKVLSVQMQYAGGDGVPCIWALCDSDALDTRRRFHWRGTSAPIELPADVKYVGTVQLPGGKAAHLFEGAVIANAVIALGPPVSESEQAAQQHDPDQPVQAG